MLNVNCGLAVTGRSLNGSRCVRNRNHGGAIDCRSAVRWLLARLRAGNKTIITPITTVATCSGSSRA